MNCVNVKEFGRTDDGGNVQIALRRRRRTDAHRLIREADMERIAIDFTVDRNRSNAHFLACPNDSARYLASIGDEDFAKSSRSVVHNSKQ